MANFDPNSIVNRSPARFQQVEGTELSVQTFGNPPETRLGPFTKINPSTGQYYEYYLESEAVANGTMIAVATNAGLGAIYNELYVWVQSETVHAWKKVDTNWPKIDPNTGRPFDQFLDWYSPLAE